MPGTRCERRLGKGDQGREEAKDPARARNQTLIALAETVLAMVRAKKGISPGWIGEDAWTGTPITYIAQP